MDVEVLRKIFEGDPNNVQIRKEEVIDVVYDSGPVVSIYTGSKHASFHDEFTQIAPGIPVLRTLIERLEAEGYSMNID